MADIFISYAKKDRESVEPFAKALVEQGWSVFWDRAIPGGKTWDEVIEEELDAAKCVIVVWPKISITSRWVRAEAEEGLNRNILVPVSIEDVKIPLLFRPIQSVRLIKWQQDSNHPQFVKLISDLSSILGPSPKKVKEAEQRRAEEERRRKQEQERKLREKEQKHIEAARKAEEEKRRKEQEELKRKAEEERKRTEAEAERKAEEERKKKEIEEKRREKKAKIKPDKPEPFKIKPSEPRKTSNVLKFGVLAGVAVLLIAGILWWVSQQQVKKFWQEIEKLDRQALNLENEIAKLDKPEQIEGLHKQRDTLSHQVEGLSESATKVGLETQLEELHNPSVPI